MTSICLSPEVTYPRREAAANAAGILPGHLLVQTAAGVSVNGTADDVPVRAIFADINIGDAGDLDTAYVSGENVHYISAPSGSYVTGRVGASITLTKGAEVASAGDGTLKAPAAAGVGVIGYAQEAVATGAGESAFIAIEIL